jgi:Hydantoinase/oxoprolinase N-terminal region
VPRSLVREVNERVAYDGKILVRLDEDQVRDVVQRLLDEGVQAFVIGDRLRIDNHGTDVQAEGLNGFTFCCFKGAVLHAGSSAVTNQTKTSAFILCSAIDGRIRPDVLCDRTWRFAVARGRWRRLSPSAQLAGS